MLQEHWKQFLDAAKATMRIATSPRHVFHEATEFKRQHSRLLVVTGFEPGEQHVGAILCKQILEAYPVDRRTVVAICPRGDVQGSFGVQHRLERRFEVAYRPFQGLAGRLIEYLSHRLVFQRNVKKLVDQCATIGRNMDCDAILVVLESPTLICLAEPLARRLQKPLLCFVMDGPVCQCRNFDYGASSIQSVVRRFEKAIQTSVRVGVSGESMKEVYEQRYQKPCFILRQGLECPYSAPLLPLPESNDDMITIGFSGTVSAPDAFSSLLDELDRHQWRMGSYSFKLRIVGSSWKLASKGPANIEYLGWRSVPDLIQLMSECDAVYLPQPFAEERREVAELSFPNKLCTYMPSNVPVALHAPRYASLTKFYDRFPCGPVVHQLEAKELLDAFVRIKSDSNYRASFVTNIQRAFAAELNHSELAKNSRRFLQAIV